jgi:hypothetical protein
MILMSVAIIPLQIFNFMKDVSTHQNAYLASADRIFLAFHIDRLNDVYNLIRYEKPVFAYIDPQNLSVGHVSSQLEPVG